MSHKSRRKGFVKIAVISAGVLVAGVLAAVSYFSGNGDGDSSTIDLTYAAKRADFVSSIIESGDVESSSNQEIRCRVRERGGTAILKIVDEGTNVKKGDFLVQLDDSGFRDELVEQRIRVATDRASVIQAESDLNTAERTLEEFERGQFKQELATYQAELAVAEEAYRRSVDFKKYSENLARKGYVTKAQLEADQFAVRKSEKELELATSKLEVYSKYTQERMQAGFKAEIKKQEANLEASQFTLQLSKQRLEQYEEKVAACHIVAPLAGQVVYANEIDGRGDSGIVIEEGVTIREGQQIIHLPDPENMQVRTKVNDSKINAVQAGHDAVIRLDTAPEVEIRGKVRRVGDFPLPRRWSQAPIEYEVFIDITEKSPLVRPGLRAKVEVFIEKIDDAVQIPVSALLERGTTYYVVVKPKDGQRELREVKIGPHNESTVVITEGLQVDEHVMIDPAEFRQEESAEGDT